MFAQGGRRVESLPRSRAVLVTPGAKLPSRGPVHEIELVLALLAGAAALQMLARRIRVPPPSLLVIAGLALALVPGLPRLDQDPEVLFLVFVPPLLYFTAVNTSIRRLRDLFGSIARLATVLVLVTMTGVAIVAHSMSQMLPWSAAFLLGAIVAPPDPVAASAVTRPLGVSRDITAILEGEGLFNDATALVAYNVALAAVLTGRFSLPTAALRLVLAGAGGIAIGLVAGWAIVFARRRIGRFAIVENTLSLISPFIAYIPADLIGASGVLAVVTLGLYVARSEFTIASPAARVQAEATWTMIRFILESIIFMMVGLELPSVMRELHGRPISHLVEITAAVTLVCIVLRFAWVALSVSALRTVRRLQHEPAAPPWRDAALVAWAGMRGGDSLVIALAIPYTVARGTAFPGRPLIIFVTFGVILATLVVQGLTLTPIVRWLGLHDVDENDALGEAIARRAMAETALRHIDHVTPDVASEDPRMLARMRSLYTLRRDRWHAQEDAEANRRSRRAREREEAWDRTAASHAKLQREIIDAERRTLGLLRTDERVSEDVLQRLQRELDLEYMLSESNEAGDDRLGESPYEVGDVGDIDVE